MPCIVEGRYYNDAELCTECNEPFLPEDLVPRETGALVCMLCAAEMGWIRCDWCGCWIEDGTGTHAKCAEDQGEPL